MNRERQSSEHETVGRPQKVSESDSVLSNPVTPTESRSFKKERNVDQTICVEKKSTSQNSKTTVEDNVSKVDTDESSNSPKNTYVEEHIPEFSKAKENFERAIAMTRVEEPSVVTTKVIRRFEPRFDADTLELIREIGSAILNSPQKSEFEEKGDESTQPESGLVRHFVRNIEKKTKDLKKKKEIIIIDKDSQERKQSWRWSSPTSQQTETSPGSPAKKTLAQSLSSPVLSMKNFSPKGDKTLSSPSGSPPQPVELSSSPSKFPSGSLQKGGLFSQILPKETSASEGAHKSSSVSESLLEENIPDVKNLVGKYEGCQQCTSSSGHSNTPSLPDIKEDNSSESLKSLDQNEKIKKNSESDNSSGHSDSEDPTNENCVRLRQLRNQLKKTSQLTHRPKSVEVVYRRNSASPGINWFSVDSGKGNQSGFSLEGRKVRKLQGKSHPLTKLELRRQFYNTM